MYRTIRRWVDAHIALFGSVIVGLAVVLFIVSRFVADVGRWIQTSGFFAVLAIALLVDILGRLVDPDPQLDVYEDWEGTREATVNFIRAGRPRTADLLEYSCWQLGWLMSELQRTQTRVRILVAHPDSAVSPREKRRIEDNLDMLQHDYPNYVIRLYRAPAGLRGRRLDDLLALSWYAHSYDENGELCISGHQNAVILGRNYTKQGRNLERTFDSVFHALWDDQNSVALETYTGTRR